MLGSIHLFLSLPSGFLISKESGRINIDRDAFPRSQGTAFSAFEQECPKLSRVFRKHQDLDPMPPPNPPDRAGFGVPQFHSRGQQGPESGHQFGTLGSASVFSGFSDHQPGHSTDRWESEPDSLSKLPFRERLEIVLRSHDDRWCIGLERLDDRPAGSCTSSAASSDLGNQLEGSFRGSKIRQIECGIGIDHTHQTDAGKIQTLGDHLGSHEHPDVTSGETVECLVKII